MTDKQQPAAAPKEESSEQHVCRPCGSSVLSARSASIALSPSRFLGGEALDDPAMQAEFSDGDGRWDIPRMADTIVELRRTASTTSPATAAVEAAREIAREINGGDRADCTYPPALAALLDDCSIANEQALAEWLTSILSRHFPVSEQRHYFCSCGAACTAEEYIEHLIEKGHDRGIHRRSAAGESNE